MTITLAKKTHLQLSRDISPELKMDVLKKGIVINIHLIEARPYRTEKLYHP